MSTDLAPLIENWLLFPAKESDENIKAVAGEIPSWLNGSYYVNGPARFQRNDFRYHHWLDGDGMVRALHISNGSAHFVSRFVRTTKLVEEELADRALYRTFGTSFPGDRTRRGVMLEAPYNVSVYSLGQKLLAFAEQSIPIELDPVTLETKGVVDFNGKLNEISPFSAHARFDPETKVMVNFGISFSATNPLLWIYEISPQGELLGRRRFPVDAPHTNHDFAITSRHAAFFLSPLEMDFNRFYSEGVSVLDALSWKPERGSYILVAPRVGQSGEAFKIRRPDGHCLHLINAYEEGAWLYLDIIEFKRPIYPEYRPVPNFYQTVDLGRPVRYVIDLENQALVAREELSYNRAPDFPSVNPKLVGRNYSDFWMLGISAAEGKGRKFFDHLAHASWAGKGVQDIHYAPQGCYYGGEPIFVGNPANPNQGVIPILEFNSRTDQVSFLFFNAFDVAAGPIVRLPLKDKTHPAFHASFKPA